MVKSISHIGPAGSGKTTQLISMLSASTIVVAMTSASKNNICARTNNRFKHIYTIEAANRQLKSADVLIVDEAGFIDVDSIVFQISKCK